LVFHPDPELVEGEGPAFRDSLSPLLARTADLGEQPALATR
jgi:hypothetical protein